MLQNIKIKVLSKFQRSTLAEQAQITPMDVEIFKEPEIEVASDDTFKYLLLTVSGLLIIVSCLMLANTWVTRKHMNQATDDRETLRQIRAEQQVARTRQNLEMQPEQVEDYSESASDLQDESESAAGGVND